MTCAGKGKRRAARIAGTVLIAAGVLTALILTGIELFIRPTLKRLLDYKCRTAAERIICNNRYSVWDRYFRNRARIKTRPHRRYDRR